MKIETNRLIRKYLRQQTLLNPQPPKNAPTDFWLSVLHYQKMFYSGPKYSMGGIADFSHLSVHAEMELDEMVGKYPEAWLFWMFEEIGWFDPEPEGDPDKLVILGPEGYWNVDDEAWTIVGFATTFTVRQAEKMLLPMNSKWLSQAAAILQDSEGTPAADPEPFPFEKEAYAAWQKRQKEKKQ